MKIAIIGGGISGLGAACLLDGHHDVTVFEKNEYAGGHSNTVEVPVSQTRSLPVDTGFIVYNERTYPNLIGLFDYLGIERIKTDMSFAVSADQGKLEYGGGTLKSLFAQKRNIFSPRFYQMVRDILRFYKTAPNLLETGRCAGMTLADMLHRDRYSKAFIEDHLLPMAAAIWSCPVSMMGSFPAESFIRFFDNHGLLQVENRPQWWTVKGGSRVYVKAICSALRRQIRTDTVIKAVHRKETGVLVEIDGRPAQYFDQVIFACHGDEAYGLLQGKTPLETSILGAFRYQRNRAVLHQDPTQMPLRKAVWSSWNYLTDRSHDLEERQVSVTYWMNLLQSLDPAHPLFVTLNPLREIDPAKIVRSFDYDHPVFNQAAIDAQGRLPRIQGQGGIWYCGSYCGYGFHEDGLGSATAVARAMGCDVPWGDHPVHAMQAIGTAQDLGTRDSLVERSPPQENAA